MRLYRLGVPENFYFDEVYFGYTAQRCLVGSHDAYDPYAPHPEKVFIEWTHPPLGKLIIAAGMALAGDNSYGLRVSSVFMGVLGIVLVFLLSIALFSSPRGADRGGAV